MAMTEAEIKEVQIKKQTLKQMVSFYVNHLNNVGKMLETASSEDDLDNVIKSLRELDIDVPFLDTRTAEHAKKLHAFLVWVEDGTDRDVQIQDTEDPEFLMYVLMSFNLLHAALDASSDDKNVTLYDAILVIHDRMVDSTAIDDEDWLILFNLLENHKNTTK